MIFHIYNQHPAPSIQHPVSSIQHPVSSIQYPASSIQHPVSSIQYPVSSIQYPVSNIQLRISEKFSFEIQMQSRICYSPKSLHLMQTTKWSYDCNRRHRVFRGFHPPSRFFSEPYLLSAKGRSVVPFIEPCGFRPRLPCLSISGLPPVHHP
jgi:hypothetical protein